VISDDLISRPKCGVHDGAEKALYSCINEDEGPVVIADLKDVPCDVHTKEASYCAEGVEDPKH